MNANEIRNQVLLGSHTAVKAFVKSAIIAHVGGSYDGSGGVFVDANTKVEIYQRARTAQAILGPTFKVSRPWAIQIDALGPQFYRFRVTVR